VNPQNVPTSKMRTPPAAPSGYLLAAAAMLLLAPVSLLAWPLAVAALRAGARRAGARRWVLAVCGLVPGIVAAVFVAPRMGAQAWLAASQVFSVVGSPVVPSWGLLGPLVAWFGRWAVLTAPIGIPVGMVAAAVPPSLPDLPAPEWEARERRTKRRAEARTRKRARRRADREGADLRSNALAVSLGGMVASWRIGDLIVPPDGQLGLAWLLIGAPGAGKTTAQYRLGYLAGLERRHLVVVDAKGGHDGLAQGMVAAYLAAWPDARVRLFPQERLDIWRGTPQEVVNRLVEVWDWSAESSYWRESAMTALRLALGQPGPPCRSGAELVRRLDPAALERAWEHDPEILGLVRSMAKGKNNELAGVHIRVGNLVAALGGALDGEVSWEDADCWVVTVPAMVASRDADSALRVMLADYSHFTMARKRRGQPSLLMVDAFSAIAGGRRSAIDLLERGRGAGAGVVLAGQSAVALGSEEERARLLAAASAILLFRTPQPSELAALAGTERVAEGAWGFQGLEQADQPNRVTVTMRARARVDQDQVRQLPTGEADLIVRGLAERIRIIRTRVPGSVETVARGLTAPPIAGTLHPSTPGRAVASRVSGPPPAPQAPRRPKNRPAASELDPPSSSPIRRYRPPGPGGEASPPDDRANQEV
jgi:hypothetical protein